MTSVLTKDSWLDLACPMTAESERLTRAHATTQGVVTRGEIDGRQAVQRLAEAVAYDTRIANLPLYRLTSIDIRPGSITGTVEAAPFVEYALTADLLERELLDALATRASVNRGELPLRDRYLPDLASVLDLPSRLCAGGVVALCAVARPPEPGRGARDYALLIQERSSQVLNASGTLSVIPKGFHEPLKDVRADARIGATLLREMEEELFGRVEVDSTIGDQRVAAPMHPVRLSEPMRWLAQRPGRMRAECTGFGLNLVSGNYEFAGLIVIDDEEFWNRYGGHLEANWEASALRLYSSLDRELVTQLVGDPAWSNEGLFALLQGIRRLQEVGGARVDLPDVEPGLGS